MLCYHGTSADNLQSIKKHGLSCYKEKIWTASQDAVYCWTLDFIKTEYPDYIEENDEESITNTLITEAFNSAFGFPKYTHTF